MTSSLSTIIILIVLFICSFIFSLLINGLFLKFSKTLGIRDKNETVIRWGPQSKPAFGGISFFIVFLFSLIAGPIIFKDSIDFHNIMFIGFILSVTLGFLMGLFDDAYNTRPWLKFSVQLLCGIILICTGTYIQIFSSTILNYLLTIFWVVGIMNSVNMLDNIDAVVTVVAIFILTTVGVSLVMLNKTDINAADILLIIGLLGALLGFLIYNWHPSKMYMGDTGSQLLGVFLAVIGIRYLWNMQDAEGNVIHSKQILTVVLVFLLPLVDTTTVVIKRLAKGTSPFVGGKDHTTHHLSRLLVSDKKVVYIFIFISFVSSVFALNIMNFMKQWNCIRFVIFAVYCLIIFSILFYISLTKRTGIKR